MDISAILLLIFSGLTTLVAGSGLIVLTRRQIRKRKMEQAARVIPDDGSARMEQEQKNGVWAETLLQRKAESDARLQAEQEAARLKAEEETRIQIAAAILYKKEEQLQLWAESAVHQRTIEQARLQDLIKVLLRDEEQAARRKVVEEQKVRLKAEEACLLAEQEVARLKVQEETRLRAEAEAALLLAEQEAARLKADEKTRLDEEQEVARVKAQEEARRQAEEIDRLKAEDEEKARILAGEEAVRLKAEEQFRLHTEADAADSPQDDHGTDWLRQLEALMQQESAPHTVEKDTSSPDDGEQDRLDAEDEAARLKAEKELRFAEIEAASQQPDESDTPYIRKLKSEYRKQAYRLLGEEPPPLPRRSRKSIPPQDRGGRPRLDGADEEDGDSATPVLGENENRAISTIFPYVPTHFKLSGPILPDDHEGPGPLFLGGPPLMKGGNSSDWAAIKKIVAGQEGHGRNRWKIHFAPDYLMAEQSFPPALTIRRGGWYFVRFYDMNDTLVQSMDFRFTDSLKKIIVDPHPPIPGPAGHLPVRVEFTHNEGATIRLIEGKEDDLLVQRTGTKTIVTIPPAPVWDRTRWVVDVGNDVYTEVAVLLRRVWWAVGDDDYARVQANLLDRPRVVSRRFFSGATKQNLWLRFPIECWADSVMAGFSRQRYRTFRVEVDKKRISVPLESFRMDRELKDISREHSLDAWISSGGHELHLSGIVRIPAEKLFSIAPDPVEVEEKRKADEIAARKLALKTYDFLDLPVNCKCCSTCSYATINEIGIQCFVGTWEERIDRKTFYYEHGTHCCSRWQGEYIGPAGVILTE